MAGLVQTQSIILASTSPLRRQLLQSAGLDFEVMASPYDEEAHKHDLEHRPIPERALYLAHGKAEAVSQLHPQAVVIAADQIGEFNGQALFKPHDRDTAIATLFDMQGQVHYQHCAACIYQHGELLVEFVDSIAMTMRAMTQAQVAAYIDIDQPLACCGGYQYEGLGKYLFANVDGCYESILGLPLLDVLNYLQDAGIAGFFDAPV